MARATSAVSSDRVWSRASNDHAMSKNLFFLMISFWTTLGIASSAIAANMAIAAHLPLGWMLTIGVLVVSLVGVTIAMASDNPVFSLLGYAMVTIPFGLLLGPVVTHYTSASVVKVLLVSGGMTATLGLVGAVLPDSLDSWGGPLFGGISVLLLGLFIIPIAGAFGLPIEGALRFWDWVGVVLFSGYLIYDFNRAARVQRTHDNAIDVALAVYLDFANIFIRLLELTGVKKD